VSGPETLERAAAEMAGRTVWCMTGLPAGRESARRLHALLNRLGAEGVAVRRRQVPAPEPLHALAERLERMLEGAAMQPARLGPAEEEIYAQAVGDGDALVGRDVGADDVVVLHDPQVAPLARVARERGAHVVWRPSIASTHDEGAGRAWGFLRHRGPIDALLLTTHRPLGESAALERLMVAMPSVETVAARDIRASREGSRETAWLGVLAGIVHDDRSETVGGIRHARPTVAVR
jgi:hypothetical protein